MNDKDRLIQILGNQIVIMHTLKRILPDEAIYMADGMVEYGKPPDIITVLDNGIERSTSLMPLYGEGEDTDD